MSWAAAGTASSNGSRTAARRFMAGASGGGYQEPEASATAQWKPVADASGSCLRLLLSRLLLLLLFVAPQPAQRVRQDGAAVLAVVAAVAVDELVVVLHVLQRRRHLLVGQRPVAVFVVQVAAA